jgi:ABC-type sugar transport system substrate-binding protein
MTKTVSLLLDQQDNAYQQVLARDAARRGAARGIRLLAPLYAEGSAVTQMEQLLACTRGDSRADAAILVSAGSESQLPACKHVAKAGLSLVFLNRVPAYCADLSAAHPDVLVASVAPDQRAIGRLQAQQCSRLLPPGAFVLLITGPPRNPTVVARTEGFLTGIEAHASTHILEAQWTEESAFKALSDWLRFGADRDRPIGSVVCQNDSMGRGARRAFRQRAAGSADEAWSRVAILGCDGLPEEGQALVRSGELAATIVVPSTTPAAIDALASYWEEGQRSPSISLAPESFPVLEQIALPGR